MSRFIVILFLCLSITACSVSEKWDLAVGYVSAFASGEAEKREDDTNKLSPESYLRKLSMHLRGFHPSPEEYLAIEKARSKSEVRAILKSKVEEYLNSEAYFDKMDFRLSELFLLQPNFSYSIWPNMEQDDFNGYNNDGRYQKYNALNFLFHSLARGNLSWDSLLTAKNYTSYFVPGFNVFGHYDYKFWQAVAMDQLPPTPDTAFSEAIPFSVNFDSSDVRVAGALTTPRFFKRYTTTAVNQNRKRAAAIFRIFLCDEMKAAVVGSADNLDPLFELVFPEHSGLSEEEIGKFIGEGKGHGDSPDCMACHYKLDPMGKTFQYSSAALAPRPSSGALSFKRKNGELINIPVRGIGELGKAIAEQKEYVSCQTERFWSWFIGEDYPLTAERRARLEADFESVGRRTNDFVSLLVTSDEFWEKPLLEGDVQELIRKVKGVLKNCDTCHLGVNPSPAPSFVEWPIGGSPETAKRWIKRISSAMDLKGDGSDARMPPEGSPWQPSAEERDGIKKWIELGAPNERGEKTGGEL
ncbi:MAG: hypothetical protein AB7O96_10385 [Pseudobdellovibrionaceae bacterium]